MTESSEDATVVTFNRSREHAQAQAAPRVMPPERADFGALSAALSADIPIPGDGPSAPAPVAESADGAAAHVSVPAGPREQGGADGMSGGEASFRQIRLGVTAGLVVLLVAVWIWQRASSRR